MRPVTLDKSHQASLYTGIIPGAAAAFTYKLITQSSNQLHIIFGHHYQMLETLAQSLTAFSSILSPKPFHIHLLPLMEDMDIDAEHSSLDHYCELLKTLSVLKDASLDHTTLILATPEAFFQNLPSPERFRQKELRLEVGQSQDLKQLAHYLSEELGYTQDSICEAPGKFALRGGLLDIYPLNADNPFRIDFFDTHIEGIRSFDPTSQRSLESLNSIAILANASALKSQESVSLNSYLPHNVHWILQEPQTLLEEFPALFQCPEHIQAPSASFQFLLKNRNVGDQWSGIQTSSTANTFFSSHPVHPIAARALSVYDGTGSKLIGLDRFKQESELRKLFFSQLLAFQKQGKRIHIFLHKAEEQERFLEILNEDPTLKAFQPEFHVAHIQAAFIVPAFFEDKTDYVAISSDCIFGRRARQVGSSKGRKRKQSSQVDHLLNFSQVKLGDYLVHQEHGVCRYRGLESMSSKYGKEELISLEFEDNITLHLKIQDIYLLSPYVGLAKVSPRLGRIGSKAWTKSRQEAESSALALASDLLQLQAKREKLQGFAFEADSHWQQEFEQSFLFQETPDQLKAIEATKKDMEAPQPMDRLICGDVGFGKTEVAIRAAFKAVMSGKQVAILVPTTILAQQHFTSFKERMAEYPIVVEMLSRFRSSSQQKIISKALAEGSIDIIVGTHTLLNDKIKFARLGLLIIDEEHRFGVRQKEALKAMRELVDVLSMSATPLPRTLHMALMGVRDLSVIETPPTQRLPVHTYIKEFDTELVKRAIKFELERGGQVFYLHNRVQSIYGLSEQLQSLVPTARIAVGHGQMEEAELEKVMADFVAGEYDILVCTSIIESGLDIPNCNTILIDGADRLGLAQLYQLRGRVGRFNKQAYAYLLVPSQKNLPEEAEKRLNTLVDCNTLGAGFHIAMKDLEIRGAGNLLGAEQSGHIANIGFGLYCDLLKQSIARLKGEAPALHIRAKLSLDFILLGEYPEPKANAEALQKEAPLRTHKLEAYVPTTFVKELSLRVEIYRKLAQADSVSTLRQLEEELVDRFGKLPLALEVLIQTTYIRCLAQERGLQAVETEGATLRCMWAHPEKKVYLKVGTQFPRLVNTEGLAKLREIYNFLYHQVPLYEGQKAK
jgi:transcription-repair coupling factor (superfamily II helicase)